jgi:hypothetical protein
VPRNDAALPPTGRLGHLVGTSGLTGRSFWIEGDKGKELRLSAAQTRELLTSGGYVLKRIRLRTNLPLERQAAQVTQPSSRRARYYPEAGPVTKGGYTHGI